MFEAMPAAPVLLADQGYHAHWFRQAPAAPPPASPSRKDRKMPVSHDAILHRRRHRIENLFGRLEDWRGIPTRYDRCAHVSLSAIALALSIIFWINQVSPEPWLP